MELEKYYDMVRQIEAFAFESEMNLVDIMKTMPEEIRDLVPDDGGIVTLIWSIAGWSMAAAMRDQLKKDLVVE